MAGRRGGGIGWNGDVREHMGGSRKQMYKAGQIKTESGFSKTRSQDKKSL